MKFSNIMVMFAAAFTFFTVSLYAVSDKASTAGPSFFAGNGAIFGTNDIVGVGSSYTFTFSDMHNLAPVGGIGYCILDNFLGWSTGARYSYGKNDRVLVHLLYGTCGFDSFENSNDNLEVNKTYYGFTALTGYQRITENGFDFVMAVGLTDEMDMAVTITAGYKL